MKRNDAILVLLVHYKCMMYIFENFYLNLSFHILFFIFKMITTLRNVTLKISSINCTGTHFVVIYDNIVANTVETEVYYMSVFQNSRGCALPARPVEEFWRRILLIEHIQQYRFVIRLDRVSKIKFIKHLTLIFSNKNHFKVLHMN
jgi:hypothetical protein